MELFDFLLQNYADVSVKSLEGLTSLHVAAYLGELEFVRKLVHSPHSAQVNCQSTLGLTPLHLAAEQGHYAIVDFLLREGADANQPDRMDTTALAYATSSHRDDVIFLLLPQTDNPLLLGRYGKNSLDWASLKPSTFRKMRPWSESFSATSESAQKSQVIRHVMLLTSDLLATRILQDIRFSALGKSLLILEDYIAAAHAYHLAAANRTEESALEYDNAACDICCTDIKVDRFVCLSCADRDLCSNCVVKYATEAATIDGCVGHKYHQITGKSWRSSSSSYMEFLNAKGQSVEEWLEEIRANYTAQSAGQFSSCPGSTTNRA